NVQLAGYKIGHNGKLKAVDKQAVMADFVAGKLDVLVSTTVIEVGVDVPNATTMVIMSPERFGLAQLHQLRGRVGRGTVQSYCYLLLSDSKAPSRRLRALESSSDGFRLSELDLEIRGPGAIYGYAQHGALDLRLANLSDTALIALAQKMATKFIEKKEDLLQYESLAANVRAAQAVTNFN
ncbi:MAG TPA: helicase-related protein, partial [Candidatus Saccharibacteria bacterium]|nr:helicase-related protein [Candidatus Saccharibacteria bacterium]